MDRPRAGQTPFMTIATCESAAPTRTAAEPLGALRHAMQTVAALLRQAPAWY